MTNKSAIKWIVLSFLGFILTVLVLMYFKLGTYKDPVIIGDVNKAFNFLYITHIGPYHEVTQSLNKVEAFAKSSNINCNITFGEYLDNPDHVDPDRLRANVGCLIEDPQIFKGIQPTSEFKLKSIASKKYYQINFDGSPAIGPMKVYPLAKGQFSFDNSEEGVGIIEVYHIKDQGRSIVTEYFFPMNSAQ